MTVIPIKLLIIYTCTHWQQQNGTNVAYIVDYNIYIVHTVCKITVVRDMA